MRLFRLAAAFAAPLLLSLAQPAAGRPFTPRDLVTLDRVSDPKLSPDGRWVAYNLRVVDYEANKARQEIWLAATDGKATPRRIGGLQQSATSPRWSPDGQAIYFISGQSGSDQVWRMRPDGSDARQVTRLPLDVGSFKLGPDGRRLVVSVSVYPDCPTLECTRDRLAQKAKAQGSGRLYDRVFIRHWDTWADATNSHLWALNLGPDGVAAGQPTPLMRGFDGDAPSKPFGDDTDYAITGDGAVIFSARRAGKGEPWSTNFDLYRVSLGGGRVRNLTEANPAWDAGPVVSPDGRWLGYRAMKRPGFEADRFAVMLMDLKSGSTRELAPGWDRSADSLIWSSGGGSLLVTAQDVGQVRVFEIGVPGPRAPGSAATLAPVTGEGHVSAVDEAAGRIVYADENFKWPAQLFVAGQARGARPVQITNHNAEKLAGVEFADAEPFSFPGWNNETVHGYVMKPINYRPGRKYPVAFLVHGGPQGSYGNMFHYRWNYQTYAAKGYAVVFIDFHGSTGYGQAFTDAISGHWGDRPLEDLQKGWTAARQRYQFLDGDRACALGASYGGFMTYWMAGVWNQPWKCFVTHDGVFDNRMMGYSTEELWFSEWENQGTPYERPENYERFNPVNHVAQWSKPMLVIHGEKDFRIPAEQGIAAFTALQRRGIESELLVFPDENHWVLKPQNSVQWHAAVEDWLDRWIGDGRRR